MTLLLDYITRLTGASQIVKERVILDAYANNHVELLEIIQLAADPFVSFGIARVAEIVEGDEASGTLSFADFRVLCHALQTRTLSGDAARQAIRYAAETCHAATWNQVYRRVLLHDLAVIEPPTFNRLLERLGEPAGRYRIPMFQPQQCQNSNRSVKGSRLVDVALTGTRLLAILDKVARLHRSDGLIVERAELERSLQELTMHLSVPLVLDGVQLANGIYMLFDLIPLHEFREGVSSTTQRQRRGSLEGLQRNGVFDPQRVRVLPQIEIDFKPDSIDESFAEFARQAQADGHVAFVLKKPDALYQGKRSSAWTTRKLADALTHA